MSEHELKAWPEFFAPVNSGDRNRLAINFQTEERFNVAKNSVSTPISEVLEQSAALLRKAGFECRCVSMKSEARYFGFPGRHGVIRLAAHPEKARLLGQTGGPVITKITIDGRHVDHPQHITIAPEKIHSLTASAIGRYLISTSTPDK